MDDYAKLIRDYLNTFLERHKEEARLVPYVQRALNEADWQLRAAAYLKEAAPDEIKQRVGRDLELSYRQLCNSLPLPPQYGSLVFSSVATGITSSSSAVYEAVRGTLAFRQHETAATKHLADYNEIQRLNERAATVRTMLARRFPTSAAQFETAANACLAAQADPTQSATAANETRNLLDRFKGELFQAASRHRGENMTWEHMAERLIPGAMPSTTRPIVLFQEQTRVRLYASLSQVLKRRGAPEPANIQYLWSETVDHLYVVCEAIGCSAA